MAWLESVFFAANSFAGLVKPAIFVLDGPTRSARAAARLAPLVARLRAPRLVSARSRYRSAYSHALLSGLSELVGWCLWWAVGLVGPCAAPVEQTHTIRVQ